jgi:hypothetical protein
MLLIIARQMQFYKNISQLLPALPNIVVTKQSGLFSKIQSYDKINKVDI